MPSVCCVVGCKNRAGQEGIQFYPLPLKNPNMLVQWLFVLDRRGWTPTLSSRICSQHFEEDDINVRHNTVVSQLKPNAIPSIFPDPISVITTNTSEILGIRDSELCSEGSVTSIVKCRKVVTKSIRRSIPENKDNTQPLNDSINVSSKTGEEEESGVCEIQISEQEAKSLGTTSESPVKEPVPENSAVFQETPFQIKLGETVKCFSHLDLNPNVKMHI